jgi:predicted dehydrogenase
LPLTLVSLSPNRFSSRFTAASAILDSGRWQPESVRQIDMINTPRIVAVIGAGSIGYRHLRNLEHLGIERLLVCEVDPERRARLQADHPRWKWFSELSDVFEEAPDAVIVASPSASHEEHTEAAIINDCAVFIEKPLSFQMGRLEKIAEQAIHSNLVSMVACNMRFHPGPATVHKLLNAGAIGELISYRLHTGSYLPQWRPHQDYRKSYSASIETGGAILDCIHELDLALWYAGPAELITAKHLPARPIGLETDGLAEILLQHDSDAIGSIHLNFIERDYRRSCVFIGSEGTLEWDFHRLEVKQYRSGPGEIITHRLPPDWQLNDMYVDEMRYFLNCVEGRQPTQNSIGQGLSCLKLALEVRGFRA